MSDEFDTTPAPWRNPRKPAKQMEALKRQATTAPSVRERLARNAARRYYTDFDFSLGDYPNAQAYVDARWGSFLPGVDEDLALLADPSVHDELRRSSKGKLTDVDLAGLWACVQHIQSGGA